MKKVGVTLEVDLDEILGIDMFCISILRNWYRAVRAAQGCEVIPRVIVPHLRIKAISGLVGFVPASGYGRVIAEPNEIGAAENFRFFVPERRTYPYASDRRRRV